MTLNPTTSNDSTLINTRNIIPGEYQLHVILLKKYFFSFNEI